MLRNDSDSFERFLYFINWYNIQILKPPNSNTNEKSPRTILHRELPTRIATPNKNRKQSKPQQNHAPVPSNRQRPTLIPPVPRKLFQFLKLSRMGVRVRTNGFSRFSISLLKWLALTTRRRIKSTSTVWQIGPQPSLVNITVCVCVSCEPSIILCVGAYFEF